MRGKDGWRSQTQTVNMNEVNKGAFTHAKMFLFPFTLHPPLSDQSVISLVATTMFWSGLRSVVENQEAFT